MSEIENDTVLTAGGPLPEVLVVALGSRPFEVNITWKDGARVAVDLAPDIFTFKAFAPLRDDPDLFGTVHVVNDGSAIAWGPSDDIDMPATAIERLAEEAWTTSNFQTFSKRQ